VIITPYFVSGQFIRIYFCVADPDPESGAFLTLESGMGKNQDPDQG
jgi:hypothetical protein